VACGHETILLVEDDDAVRALSGRMLRAAGYTVVPARNGDEALAADLSRGVDLLLTDVIMPGMNGVQLAERLVDRHPHLPVLFASGYTDGMVAQLGAPGRTTAHLDKPYTAVTLTQHVRAALDRPIRPYDADVTV
jgi:two-component system, cell cycle sensor histidine kinase and response regulator CckA